jgi:hypothetical protein
MLGSAARDAPDAARAQMSDWYDYVAKKVAPKPSYQRPMPTFHREPAPEPVPEPESEGMMVEESTAGDTIVERVRRFWQTK